MSTRKLRKRRVDRGIHVRTRGLYALSSYREMAYLLAPRLFLLVGLLGLPPALDLYGQRVLCAAAVFAMPALAFDFLAEYVGLVCLGGALFIGFGGYAAGFLNARLGLSPVLTIPLGTLAGACLSTLVILPCLRLRGVYFAMVTFMIPLFARHVIVALGLLGSTEGITGLDTLPDPLIEIYVILAAVLASLFALRRLVNEDLGLILRGIKENDQAVAASGISILRYRVLAVFIASCIGCFAGAYLAHLYGWLGLSLFAMDFSILPIAAAVMGGTGTLAGPVVGAFLLTSLSEALRGFGQLRVVLYCLVLLAFILYKPEGLLKVLERKYQQFERREEV
ncbi:MAG TPA: branched-chain amino acid ABC transporter permease [Syntrophobacteraceae bacterium]|nr:branched-chain amino acid ABC transporter permease [Syntrophobacteraceae bacterium]